jgi:hypothetical protein
MALEAGMPLGVFVPTVILRPADTVPEPLRSQLNAQADQLEIAIEAIEAPLAALIVATAKQKRIDEANRQAVLAAQQRILDRETERQELYARFLQELLEHAIRDTTT